MITTRTFFQVNCDADDCEAVCYITAETDTALYDRLDRFGWAYRWVPVGAKVKHMAVGFWKHLCNDHKDT